MTAPYRKVNYARILQKYALITSLAFLAPIIVTIIGTVIVSAHNDRLKSLLLSSLFCKVMCRYNSRVREWKAEEGDFNSTIFFMGKEPLPMYHTPQEYYSPLADSCKLKGDPAEGCLYSDSSFYSMNFTTGSGSLQIPILNGMEEVISNETIPSSKSSTYSKKALNCWDASSCNTTCTSRNGKWDFAREECVVTFFLTKVCYRVTSINGTYVIDRST